MALAAQAVTPGPNHRRLGHIALPARCSWDVATDRVVAAKGPPCTRALGKPKRGAPCGCCGYSGNLPPHGSWRVVPSDIIPLLAYNKSSDRWCRLCVETLLPELNAAFSAAPAPPPTRGGVDDLGLRVWQHAHTAPQRGPTRQTFDGEMRVSAETAAQPRVSRSEAGAAAAAVLAAQTATMDM